MASRMLRAAVGITIVFALAVGGLGVSHGTAMAAPFPQETEPEEIEFSGTVLDFDETAGTLEVEVDDDSPTVYSVTAPEDFDFGELTIGDTVEVEGTLNEGGDVVATKVKIEDGDDDEDEVKVEDDGDGDKIESHFCSEADAVHPVGQGIADRFGASYEEVMAWFCEGGFGFGQIMLALTTVGTSGGSAEDLLARRAGGEGWGKIWQDLNLIGRPEDAGPPEEAGPPEWAGPPDGGGPPEEAGPPEWAGPPDDGGPPDEAGRPEWAGPPDHAGPPDWAGPPDHAGPPEWAGRPEGASPRR